MAASNVRRLPTAQEPAHIVPSEEAAPTPADAVWLTVPEAARLLRVGESLCWKLVRDGDIPSRKIGRLVRVPRSAVIPA